MKKLVLMMALALPLLGVSAEDAEDAKKNEHKLMTQYGEKRFLIEDLQKGQIVLFATIAFNKKNDNESISEVIPGTYCKFSESRNPKAEVEIIPVTREYFIDKSTRNDWSVSYKRSLIYHLPGEELSTKISSGIKRNIQWSDENQLRSLPYTFRVRHYPDTDVRQYLLPVLATEKWRKEIHLFVANDVEDLKQCIQKNIGYSEDFFKDSTLREY